MIGKIRSPARLQAHELAVPRGELIPHVEAQAGLRGSRQSAVHILFGPEIRGAAQDPHTEAAEIVAEFCNPSAPSAHALVLH